MEKGLSSRGTLINRIDDLLVHATCLIPAHGKVKEDGLQEIFNQVCENLFEDDFYKEIWDERILLNLEALFSVKKPGGIAYEMELRELAHRTALVKAANDVFFSVLDSSTQPDVVRQEILKLAQRAGIQQLELEHSLDIDDIRSTGDRPSQIIGAFIGLFREGHYYLDDELLEILDNCLKALEYRETPGRANAILINKESGKGIVVPIEIKISHGNGELESLISTTCGRLNDAINRARLNIVDIGLIDGKDDVKYTLALTDADYFGESLALPAAVSMCSSKSERVVDPYAAFTGNVNLERGEWRVKGVSGIRGKIDAAIRSGCRRLFIPEENISEIGDEGVQVQIVPVSDILQVLCELQAGAKPIMGDSRQVRKINRIRDYCGRMGLHLSQPRAVQNGVQFEITSVRDRLLKVTIYRTGTHAPKKAQEPIYDGLLGELNGLDAAEVPINKIETILNIMDVSLQDEIRKHLLKLEPSEQRSEDNCSYYFRFEEGKERLVIKQFAKGKLQLQGSAGGLYNKIINLIINLYNLKNPQSPLQVDEYLIGGEQSSIQIDKDIEGLTGKIIIPHIGTDESGKGDYFGPLVVAGVWIDGRIEKALSRLGVRDSKRLSDKRCRELASEIRKLCKGKFVVIEIPPQRYNQLYTEFKSEGKNLNHLLAWGHARAIESLLRLCSCKQVIADQFGDESYILSRLMEKGKEVELLQTPKGERYLAIAAASILARDRFVESLESIGNDYGIELPKGSSKKVVEAAKTIVTKGHKDALEKVAKLHHKTTDKVLGHVGKDQKTNTDSL